MASKYCNSNCNEKRIFNHAGSFNFIQIGHKDFIQKKKKATQTEWTTYFSSWVTGLWGSTTYLDPNPTLSFGTPPPLKSSNRGPEGCRNPLSVTNTSFIPRLIGGSAGRPPTPGRLIQPEWLRGGVFLDMGPEAGPGKPGRPLTPFEKKNIRENFSWTLNSVAHFHFGFTICISFTFMIRVRRESEWS